MRTLTNTRSKAGRGSAPPRHRLGALVLMVVIAVVLAPVAAVLTRSVQTTPALDSMGGAAWSRILGSSRTWRVIALTIGQAGFSAMASVIVGVPIAYVFARFNFVGRRMLQSVAMVPFVLPSVVIGAAFAALFSGLGASGSRGSWVLVISAHICFNLAVVIRMVGAAFGRADGDSEAAAQLLGRSRLGAFFGVLLPQVAATVAAAAVVVFLFCLTSFGVIVILGGGAVTTIEVEIWIRATRQFDLSGAAVLSAVQFAAVMATLGLDVVVARRIPVTRQRLTTRRRRPGARSEFLMVASASIVIAAVCGLPLLALVYRSLQVPGGLGLDNWLNLGSVLDQTAFVSSPLRSVANSLRSAALATVVVAPMALLCGRYLGTRRTRMGEGLVLLPLGVSATTVGLGLLILFGSPPLDLRGSGWLVPAAQVLVAMPLATRVLVPAVRSLDTAVMDVALVLGATQRKRFWRVELRLLLPALVAAGGLGFVACLGEFGATVFVSRAETATVPVMVERLLSRPGGAGYSQAMALAVILAVVCGTVLAIIDRIGATDGREVLPI